MKDKMTAESEQRGTIRPLPFTFSGRFFLLLAIGSALLVPVYLYLDTGLGIPLGLDAALILLAFLDFVLGPSPKHFSIQRSLPYPLAVDRPNEVSLEISNRARRHVSLTIEDDVPPHCSVESLPLKTIAAPGTGTAPAYRLTPLERGNGEFGNIHFWLLGRFGLVWKHGEAEAERTVKCYPGLALIERRRLHVKRSIALDPVRALRKGGEGTEFESLREYAVGDDSRLVHWSTTARRGKLIVRRNRMERSQTVFLVLDAGRMMTARVRGKTKLDHAMNAALLLAYSALELGDNVGIMVVGQDVEVFLPPAKTPGQFARILDAIYALRAKMEEPRFYRALSDVSTKMKRRALFIIFTDLVDRRASEGLIRYSLGLLPRHLPLVVAMSDTEVVELADSMPKNKSDFYRQGVAAEMLERREQVLARLSSVGVSVMDIPPENISASVLERYLDIKMRNLL